MNNIDKKIEDIIYSQYDKDTFIIKEVILDWRNYRYPFVAFKILRKKELFWIIKEKYIYVLQNIIWSYNEENTEYKYWTAFWSWKYIYETNDLNKLFSVIELYKDADNKLSEIEDYIKEKNLNLQISTVMVNNNTYSQWWNEFDNAYLTKALKFEFTIFNKQTLSFLDCNFTDFYKLFAVK
jgi:hypothetical protein